MTKCPHCTSGTMSEVAYQNDVLTSWCQVSVDGLLKFVCNTCSGEVVTREQFRSNRKKIAEAVERTK